MILLEYEEIEIARESYSVESRKIWGMDRTRGWKLKRTDALESCFERVAKATGKKILIELQRIYNLPDEGMFNNQMKEFIEQLLKEVKQ